MELVIYVPGLGSESILEKQRNITAKWINPNRDILFLEPEWGDVNEDFDSKLERLLKVIKEYDFNKYDKVLFFGASAGGTLGLNLFNSFKDNPKVYFKAICGKIIGPQYIGASYSKPHPALIPSVQYSVNLVEDVLQQEHLDRITSIIPIFDEVVNKKCMKVKGAKIKRQLTILHIPSIALGITLLSNKYIHDIDS